MINNVTLIGRLTKDVELKRTPSDIATAQFTIACNRNFKMPMENMMHIL